MIGIHASNAVGVGSIPGWGINIPHAALRQKKKKDKKKQHHWVGARAKKRKSQVGGVCGCGVEEWSEN